MIDIEQGAVQASDESLLKLLASKDFIHKGKLRKPKSSLVLDQVS